MSKRGIPQSAPDFDEKSLLGKPSDIGATPEIIPFWVGVGLLAAFVAMCLLAAALR